LVAKWVFSSTVEDKLRTSLSGMLIEFTFQILAGPEAERVIFEV